VSVPVGLLLLGAVLAAVALSGWRPRLPAWLADRAAPEAVVAAARQAGAPAEAGALAAARARAVLVAGAAGFVVAAPAGLLPGLAAAGGAGLLAGAVWRRRIAGRGARRRAAIEASLPDALDLLAGVVEAGVPLDAALAAVCEATAGPLHEELAACVSRLGGSGNRRGAFRAFSASGVPDLARVGAALATADELGAPLAALLRDQASLQRELRRMRVRERAARASPKIALVVSFLLVPAGLVLVLGSQALGLLAELRG
jgi:tight adherence protein C